MHYTEIRLLRTNEVLKSTNLPSIQVGDEVILNGQSYVVITRVFNIDIWVVVINVAVI